MGEICNAILGLYSIWVIGEAHTQDRMEGQMIDTAKFRVALERFAMGLRSADKQLRPKSAEDGGRAMAYAFSVALGAVEMPEATPMELAWDHWARRKADVPETALAMAMLAQLVPPPLREEDLPLLGQIGLWLDLVDYADDENPDSDNLAASRLSAEAQLAEETAGQAIDDLAAARMALRDCLMAEADTTACDPQREALAAAERQLEAVAELLVAGVA